MGEKSQNMKWWQLSLFGVGCIIGTGFFLGSSIAIKKGGPAVLISFIFAAIATYIVFDALAKMTAADPKKGAFRAYAKKAYGRWAGFSVGWVYCASEMLIMGSQLTALSIFMGFWFPDIPMWVFASCFAVLGIIVLVTGAEGLNKVENIFALIKISAIVMFTILAVLGIVGVLNGKQSLDVPSSIGEFFPNKITGLWSSLIFAFYAFGGIEVMALMATKLKDPNDAQKSGKIMLMLLTTIYIVSIGLAVMLVSWRAFSGQKSPFITALKNFDLPIVPHLLNGALIIAGFSTMVAALYGVTTILVMLAKDKDAPLFFAKQGRLKIPLPALSFVIAGLLASIIMALAMPDSIYEYITTGAALMLLYNWIFIILSARRLLEVTKFQQLKYWVGIILILLGVSGTLLDKDGRPGFYISLCFTGTIAILTILIHKARTKEENPISNTVFKRLEKLE